MELNIQLAENKERIDALHDALLGFIAVHRLVIAQLLQDNPQSSEALASIDPDKFEAMLQAGPHRDGVILAARRELLEVQKMLIPPSGHPTRQR